MSRKVVYVQWKSCTMVLRGILQDSEEIDENLTDDDDDIVSDNKSERDE